MEEQSSFFSPDHGKLLSIAVWAKYLAWVALILGILYAGISTVGRYMSQWQMVYQVGGFGGNTNDILALLNGNPAYLIDLVIDLVYGILKAVIYYLVLKGISLGLNMIVETDINYRENSLVEGENG